MLFEIFNLRGTPSEESWSGIENLKDYKKSFPQFKKRDLKKHLNNSLSEAGFDLLEKMLEMDPVKRIGL